MKHNILLKLRPFEFLAAVNHVRARQKDILLLFIFLQKVLSLVFLFISKLISRLRLHQFLGTKAIVANKSLKTDANGAY